MAETEILISGDFSDLQVFRVIWPALPSWGTKIPYLKIEQVTLQADMPS